MSGYSVRNVDLSAPFEAYSLVPPGTRVRSLLVTKFAGGTDLQVAVGGQPLFYVPSVGSFDFDSSDWSTTANGITLTNTVAQPGVIVQFVVIPVGD